MTSHDITHKSPCNHASQHSPKLTDLETFRSCCVWLVTLLSGAPTGSPLRWSCDTLHMSLLDMSEHLVDTVDWGDVMVNVVSHLFEWVTGGRGWGAGDVKLSSKASLPTVLANEGVRLEK